ncbi:MAG: PAS domain S-box protein, partial [Spirochaetales bacterium]|nr:PAS domain S-box protein [Spirochaetales bacterium]
MEKIKTLRRAFYMIILPFNASVIFLFFFLIQWLELKETYSGLREKLIITLQQENAKLAYPLWVLDYERLEELSIALLNDSDIRGINIYGDDDSPIVTMGTTKGYMRETMDFLSYRENAKDEALSGLPVFFLEALAIYDSREKSFSRGSPILYQSGKEEIPVGSVYLTISDRNIRGSFIRQLRLFIIFFLAIFTLISLSVSFAYYWTVQLPLREIRSFIREKEKLGSIIKDHPEEDRSNDLSYIRKRFERLWNRQDDLLQELHNSKEYYRNLLNSLPMGVVLIDREDLILESNFAFQVLTGYSEREIRRMTMEDFTPEPYQASDKKNLEVLKATGLFKPYEKRIKTRKGREIPVRLNGSSISRGDEYRIIISFEDISE